MVHTSHSFQPQLERPFRHPPTSMIGPTVSHCPITEKLGGQVWVCSTRPRTPILGRNVTVKFLHFPLFAVPSHPNPNLLDLSVSGVEIPYSEAYSGQFHSGN